MGEPLSRVAIAESLASVGDLVICPATHALLHPSVEARSPTSIESSGMHSPSKPNCSCTGLHDGYYQLCKPAEFLFTTPTKMSRTAKKLRQSLAMDETFVLDTKLVNSIEQDVEAAYDLLLSHVVASNTAQLSQDSQKNIKHQCLSWLSSCLSVDLAQHTHHVTRNNAKLSVISRVHMFADQLAAENLNSFAASIIPFPVELLECSTPPHRSLLSPILRPSSLPTSPGVNRRPSLKRISSKLLNIHDPDALSTAEIRSVAVLFIKIDVTNTSLCHDEYSKAPQTPISAANNVFCQRSALEVAADDVLLAQLQSSFECISTSLNVFGGQMRQFIVDDKGMSVILF